MEATGALPVSRGSEDSERLPVQVLETRADKWMQGASMLQGISLKKRMRGRMIDMGRPSCFGEWGPITLFSKGLSYLSHKWCCVHYLLALEACEIFYDPLLIKAAQPENLFSLKVFFLYISNLCQPQKVSNKVTFSWGKGAASYNKKEPISSKVWCGYFQGYTCFSYILTMLTNALPGAQWIRDMGT